MALIRKPDLTPLASWPNWETMANSSKIMVNLACYLMESSLATTAIVNLPLRCISVYQTPDSKRHYKLPMDIAAFLILPWPHGILFSMWIDTVSETINFYNRHGKDHYQNHPTVSSSKRLDPKNIENACKILDLKPEEKANRGKIDLQYNKLLQNLEKRKSNASEPIATGLEELINDIKQAYITLTQK